MIVLGIILYVLSMLMPDWGVDGRLVHACSLIGIVLIVIGLILLVLSFVRPEMHVGGRRYWY